MCNLRSNAALRFTLADAGPEPYTDRMSEILYGIHAIGEALKRGGRRFDYVAVSRDRTDARLQKILDDCRAQGISVRFVPREDIDRQTRTNTHQGIMAFTSRKEYTGAEELLEHKHGDYSFLLVLDGVEDPHNLGALLRSADGAGVDGVIIPERRAAGITGAVVKASAGASEHLRIARVVNIARTLDELKEQNVWVVGLDERGEQSYDELDYNMNCAIVMGAEGKGLHDLVRRKCDMLVSIPMRGAVSSLNVSVAGGIVMYEVQRQRRQAQKPAAQRPAKKKRSAE
jgi:23S rRNA (guanosine2251-2'-O)-methyltransferase